MCDTVKTSGLFTFFPIIYFHGNLAASGSASRIPLPPVEMSFPVAPSSNTRLGTPVAPNNATHTHKSEYHPLLGTTISIPPPPPSSLDREADRDTEKDTDAGIVALADADKDTDTGTDTDTQTQTQTQTQTHRHRHRHTDLYLGELCLCDVAVGYGFVHV